MSRTYYRGPDAVVTDKLFVWRTTPTKGFVVRDLRSVQLVRTQGSRVGPYAAPVVGGAMVLAAALWTTLGGLPALYAVGALSVAVPAGLAVGARMRPQLWELRATYRGTHVVLYLSSDARVFNQVARALRRAVEDARPPSDDHDLVAA